MWAGRYCARTFRSNDGPAGRWRPPVPDDPGSCAAEVVSALSGPRPRRGGSSASRLRCRCRPPACSCRSRCVGFAARLAAAAGRGCHLARLSLSVLRLRARRAPGRRRDERHDCGCTSGSKGGGDRAHRPLTSTGIALKGGTRKGTAVRPAPASMVTPRRAPSFGRCADLGRSASERRSTDGRIGGAVLPGVEAARWSSLPTETEAAVPLPN
jgi:hypothetical protein